MKIAEISIKRPSIVIVVFTALTLLGIISYLSLNYEMLPKFNPGVVSISTIYPGASPNEVENTVTKKLEDAVSSMENIKKLEATSFEGLSVITITLTSEADVDYAINDAQRKVNAVLSDLPDDAETPSLAKFSLDDLPIITLSATANMDDAQFFDLIDKRIQPIVSRVNGVAQVNLIGGQEREIQVNLNAAKLEAYGLSALDVQQVILNSNLDFPTGSVKTKNQDILIRLAGKYKSVNELRNLVISTADDGAQIRLMDVADVQDAQEDAEKIARLNRSGSIILQILKTSDANAVKVSEGVRAIVERLTTDYQKENLQIVIANDTSDYTLESADAVVHDLFLAVILVAVVMLFFLHSLRNAVIVMVAIPASLVATFIGIYLFGFTLNLMSLLGLSLVVGILVDDAIVVIENIYRHMEMGKNKVRASYDATKEIGFTVVSITMVIVVVFLPISVSTGLVSDILREFCVVVMISTLLSLLASFSIVPLLTSRFGKLERISNRNFIGRFILWFEKQLHRFTNWVTGILNWALDHKAITLVTVSLLLVSSCGLTFGGFIGAEFFAQSDRGEFLVQIELPKDASLELTNQVTRKAEDFLSKKKEIVSLITTVGQSSDNLGADQSTAYKAEITVKLTPKEERDESSDIYAAKLKGEIQKLLVGAKVKTVPIDILGAAQQAPIEMVVTGSDLDSVLAYAEKARALLAKVPGAAETKLSVESGNPEITVEVDRDKMTALGLSLQTVGGTMQTAFNGNTDGKYRQGEYEYDINIRFEDYDRKNIDDVRNLYFTNKDGKLIKLSQFAVVKEGSGPSQLERRDKSTSVKVQSQAVGRPSGTVIQEFEGKLGSIPKPTGVSYVWGGDMENQSEGFGTLGVALMVSIVLVYLIMVALYDSFVYPFVVMFSIPLSVIGALLALALTNNSLNIFTILGLIMLIGLVAKNAIILVDFTNQMKAEGNSTRQALIHANHARLRPILMTTIAMVIGMLPIALASSAGSEWKNGLAWVIIGGLISSLFLTLIIVPVVYQVVDNILHRLGWDKKGRPIEELMVEEYDHKEVKEYESHHG
ncbi:MULTISPECIES: efflux RND transporter permease subunit [Olivibacter]|jgi:HAE1 family hydrophobic/amphiphilic exporter-1|uniref:Efflux RND transporter permease subunit n=2 Tax=Olivibacter TaxID=376469 RepID=A0ABV6HFZ8_9SPHI|nr:MULTISPECIES: efflux RND transporter permease subunit [Olivibacter]MCL4641886.1 efflux RND transporter permease subunit [Olivibacter sp. UJ_SKK_5.1]MDM8177101.1 efflux RND transporter permease subunit [Olivibacter sp. 47]MDX3912548.1 efflux RND transporter permease subunit [Pseudosphingobacterium sp.]QEL00268.1 efflux RND transporter permease subunit [Olivibacter sp. LS-1]